eukprot:5207110-Prymnesium_polylepis.2
MRNHLDGLLRQRLATDEREQPERSGIHDELGALAAHTVQDELEQAGHECAPVATAAPRTLVPIGMLTTAVNTTGRPGRSSQPAASFGSAAWWRICCKTASRFAPGGG